MARYKIEQEHDKCISCGTCVNSCPDNWEMKKDGKAGPKKKDISEEEFDCNNIAASGCPVNIIHITNLKTKEKII